MDSRRSKKTYSAGAESKVTHTPETKERPKLGDRSNSSPSVVRPRKTHSKPQDIETSAAQDRTSGASIRDDPFFQAYQSPQSLRLAGRARYDSRRSHGNELTKYGNIPSVNLVVLGAQGVGKSTFVQRALDLRSLPLTQYSSKKMSLDGVIYLVRLLEISLESITVANDRRLRWPTKVSDRDVPPVDGVLVLYDVTNPDSISGISDVLQALSVSTVPSLLVSCKCDNPPQLRQVAPGIVRQASFALGGIDAQQTSANVPDSQKRCISMILRQILARSSEYSRRSRSKSKSKARTDPAERLPSPRAKRSQTRPPQHRRASSEVFPQALQSPVAETQASPPLSPSEVACSERQTTIDSLEQQPENQPTTSNVEVRRTIENDPPPRQPETPLTPGDLIADGPLSPTSDNQPETPYSQHSFAPESDLRPNSSDSQAHDTFLDMGDDNDVESPVERKNTKVPEIEHLKLSHPPEAITGYSLEELVDRLLSMPMTKHEARFITVFLCLYRKFTAPAQLLSLIIGRFDGLETSAEAQLIKIGDQLRYLQILAQWSSDYPGDFALPTVKTQLAGFLAKLEKSRIFAYAAKELNCNLERSSSDEEAGWVLSEEEEQESIDTPISKVLTNTSVSLTRSSTLVADKASTEDLLAKTSQQSSQEDVCSAHHSIAPSQASSGLGRFQPGSNSTQSLSTVAQNYEEAQREASTLVPTPRRPLSKDIWRRFMEVPDEDFARELTRMDWIMYKSIRPRDLVWHVSLAGARRAQKNQARNSKALQNVDRMIDHFNHLTLFVAAMILFRDKPKHRAQALEKFMNISWKLRQMNNYNSLGALLAGINNSTVTRLADTWSLLPRPITKEFMRLNILMGSAKSHFAYRLAWENSFGERIPFIPLHRRDLVAAEDGNRTNVGPNGDRINWKKFEIMGDVIIGIQKSQEKAYTFGPRNQEVGWLVLETRLLTGDEKSIDPYQELYERSVAVESARSGSDPHRKKLNDWFKR